MGETARLWNQRGSTPCSGRFLCPVHWDRAKRKSISPVLFRDVLGRCVCRAGCGSKQPICGIWRIVCFMLPIGNLISAVFSSIVLSVSCGVVCAGTYLGFWGHRDSDDGVRIDPRRWYFLLWDGKEVRGKCLRCGRSSILSVQIFGSGTKIHRLFYASCLLLFSAICCLIR